MPALKQQFGEVQKFSRSQCWTIKADVSGVELVNSRFYYSRISLGSLYDRDNIQHCYEIGTESQACVAMQHRDPYSSLGS